ncbi:MAG: hypothetical protein FJ288_15890 [Planctomycetes bacterium]|nr:hypothetical protein [Planctomycetota bacterium]
MDEAALREKVGQLLAEMQRLPVSAPAAEDPGRPLPRARSPVRREMAALEDSLDHVRLAIKYLVFDLEATKRENRLLREMLGE